MFEFYDKPHSICVINSKVKPRIAVMPVMLSNQRPGGSIKPCALVVHEECKPCYKCTPKIGLCPDWHYLVQGDYDLFYHSLEFNVCQIKAHLLASRSYLIPHLPQRLHAPRHIPLGV